MESGAPLRCARGFLWESGPEPSPRVRGSLWGEKLFKADGRQNRHFDQTGMVGMMRGDLSPKYACYAFDEEPTGAAGRKPGVTLVTTTARWSVRAEEKGL